MSSQSIWGGYSMALIIIILGVLGLIIDTLFLLAFVVLVGYYLYRIEKRVSDLEGRAPGGQPRQN